MGETEFFSLSEGLVTTELVFDIDTSTLANILGVTESVVELRSNAEKKNRVREQNLAEVVRWKRKITESGEDKLLVQTTIEEFQKSQESNGTQQDQRIAVESKMLMMGLKNPKQILGLLANNTAVNTFYDIDYSEENPKVKAFNYKAISSEFIEFIAEFDNPLLLLDRLNKLKVNISTDGIEMEREKTAELFVAICRIPEEHFQKAVSDLSEFSCIGDCGIIQDSTNLDKDFIARLWVAEKGGLTNEEKEVLKMFDDDSVICPSIVDTYGLGTVLDNKELLKNLHILLGEEVLQSNKNSFSQEIIDEVKFLEERGVLSKLSVILASGLSFSTETSLSDKYSTITRTVMDILTLKDQDNDVLRQIELAYDNLTNKEFILMRSFLDIQTIENSDLVKEALELLQLTKAQIEKLSFNQKKDLFKSLSFNKDYLFCFPNIFAQIWGDWKNEYHEVTFRGGKKVRDIMMGMLKAYRGSKQSELDLAIRQVDRKIDPRVRKDIFSINPREAKPSKIGDQKVEILPIDAVKVDKDHVIDQSMDIIQVSEDKIRIQLFLTQKAYKKALEVLQDQLYDPKVSTSTISYSDRKIAEAVAYEPISGLVISVASDSYIRAIAGLVDIHVDLSLIDKDTYIQEINSALSYLVGLGSDESLLSSTDEVSDSVLTQALYELNTKEVTPPSDTTFERKEVFNGYQTVVIPGRHEYLKKNYGSFVTYHKVSGIDNLAQVLTNGLSCSHQRYKQGVIIDGMSTSDDFRYGGANSVFTRTFSVDSPISFIGANLIFDPQIWDRLDFYIYDEDKFGNTSEEELETRLSPDEYLSQISNGKFYSTNEQMFRRGIPPEMIKGLAVWSKDLKSMIIKRLTEAGIFSINGKSIDEFIYVTDFDSDAVFSVVDIAEGLPIGTTKERKNKEKNL